MAGLPYYCYLLLLVYYLLPASTIAKDIWAINCGGSEDFTTASNITWEADDGYVSAGVSRTANNISDGAYSTLRAFEAEKPAKGCYTIPVGAGRKVLVRALFYYGNYDAKQEPPTFSLQFDASLWSTIETTMYGIASDEIIYVTAASNTSICVARGSTAQTPFISAIRLTVLGEGIYDSFDSSQALYSVSRVAFGAQNIIIDKYYRFWSSTTHSLNVSDYKTLNNSATIFSNILPDDVPMEALQTAITPFLASSNITITTPYLSSTPKPIYYNMYFTEPVNLRSSDNRSFHIFLDGQQELFKGPVNPPYGRAKEYVSAVSTGSKTTIFDLVPTVNATLPPVISAWELFVIKDVLSNGTDNRDVYGLSKLQHQFKLLQNWTGDPCLPENYNWEWVACNSDPTPRITSLNLKSYGLSGELPDFSSMDALESIDMSNNSLTGDIPAFLGSKLPNLRTLNLADNDFSAVPSSLSQNSAIKLDVSRNPKLSKRTALMTPDDAGNKKSIGNKDAKWDTISTLIACIMYFVLM